MRFRTTGRGSGKIRFKRRLNVEWRAENYDELRVCGERGEVLEAVTFGDPFASPARGPFSVGPIAFSSFRASTIFKLVSSTGRAHEVVDGPFFSQKTLGAPADNSGLTSLGALGAWVPNLPTGESLVLEVKDLVPDVEYELRVAFHDGRGRASGAIKIEPSGFLIETVRPTVAVGNFVAPESSAIVRFVSETDRPPFVNAAVLRAIKTAPRATFSFSQ